VVVGGGGRSAALPTFTIVENTQRAVYAEIPREYVPYQLYQSVLHVVDNGVERQRRSATHGTNMIRLLYSTSTYDVTRATLFSAVRVPPHILRFKISAQAAAAPCRVLYVARCWRLRSAPPTMSQRQACRRCAMPAGVRDVVQCANAHIAAPKMRCCRLSRDARHAVAAGFASTCRYGRLLAIITPLHYAFSAITPRHYATLRIFSSLRQ